MKKLLVMLGFIALLGLQAESLGSWIHHVKGEVESAAGHAEGTARHVGGDIWHGIEGGTKHAGSAVAPALTITDDSVEKFWLLTRPSLHYVVSQLTDSGINWGKLFSTTTPGDWNSLKADMIKLHDGKAFDPSTKNEVGLLSAAIKTKYNKLVKESGMEAANKFLDAVIKAFNAAGLFAPAIALTNPA